jgi:hypothetical protein
MKFLNLRTRSGRGAGPETLDQFDIEPPEGPAGVVVGEARRRMSRTGGGRTSDGEEADEQDRGEAGADAPADPLRAAEQAAPIHPAARRELRDLARTTQGTAGLLLNGYVSLSQLLDMARRLAPNAHFQTAVAKLGEAAETFLKQAAEPLAEQADHLRHLADLLDDIEIRRNAERAARTVARLANVQQWSS